MKAQFAKVQLETGNIMGGNGNAARHWTLAAAYVIISAIGWLMLLPPLVLLAVRACEALSNALPAAIESGWSGPMVTARSASAFWQAGVRTIIIGLLSTAIAMLFALPASFIITKTEHSVRTAGWSVALALAGIPLYVTVSGITRMFSLAWLIDPGSPARTLLAVGQIGGLGLAPLATIAASAAWSSVQRESEETGLLLTRPFRVWLKISLPLAAGGLIAAGILVCVLSACDMTVSDALTVRTWAEELYLAFNLELDPGKAAMSAAPLATISIAGLGILLWRGGRMAAKPVSGTGRHICRYPLGRWRVVVVVLLAVAAGIMAWPLLDLLWAGLSESAKSQAWKEAGRAAMVTMACSSAGAGMAIVLAFPLAWMAGRRRSRIFPIVVAIGALFLVSLPTALFGYAIAAFWNQPWWNSPALAWAPRLFYDTPLAVVSLYTMQTLPLAVLMLWAACKQIPASCLDAASTLSIRPFSFLITIVLPLTRNACLLTWAVCYLLSLRELGGLLLVAPPGWPFLAVRYATQIHFGVYADLAFLLAVSLPLVLLPPLALLRRSFRQTSRTERTEP